MTIKTNTLADIIMNEIPSIQKINKIKRQTFEDCGQTVIAIKVDATLAEQIGKNLITNNTTLDLYYVVDTHELIPAGEIW